MDTRKNLLTSLLLGLALVGASHPGYGASASFAPAKHYAVGTNPWGVAAGDFKGDGHMDLAVANQGDPSANDDGGVSILLGNGDGTFQAAKNLAVGKNPCVSADFSCVIAADFNGDGRLDLVVLIPGSRTVSVSLGNGDGTFQPHSDYATGDQPFGLRVADVNGDQRLDLIVLQAGAVGVLLSNGDGTFQNHVDYSTGSNPTALAVLDVNGDGNLDLVATVGSLGIETLFGNGDGSFQPGIYCVCGTQGSSGRGVTAVGPIVGGDLNGDGKMDLAALYFNTTDIFHPFKEQMVLLGNGDGTFQAIDTGFSAGGSVSTSAAITDFNGDGRSDLAIGVSGSLYVLLGHGDGTFQPPVSFDLGSVNAYTTAIAAADLNRDKSPDVIVTNALDNTISVLLNTTGTDFSIAASALNPGTVSRGQSSTSTVTLALLNAFDNPVALTCSVQPAQGAPTCSLDHDSVTFDTHGNATATLTVHTAAATASLVPPSLRDSHPIQLSWLPVAGFALMGAGFGSGWSTRKRLTSYLLGCILFGGLILQTACGGAGGGVHGTPPTTYTITVAGTSGSTQHSTTTTLTVQ